MQRVHLSPRIGSKPVDRVATAQVEAVTFLHSVFEHAIDKGWAVENPVRRARRPKRRRSGDVDPDLQFLTLEELDKVIGAIPADMFSTMRAMLSASVSTEAKGLESFTSEELVTATTMGCAKCHGIEDRVGSLTPGKRADIQLLRTDDANLAPFEAPDVNLVYDSSSIRATRRSSIP
ncbi:MAG TPA: amidohydrolase family protein [Baekduia sp.]|nr:amidohydrolase family protein [Baekduia sp.]